VQTINPPGSEVGPVGVATWGKSLADEADAMGFKWRRKGRNTFHSNGAAHKKLFTMNEDKY
jgi:hypothetical protein